MQNLLYLHSRETAYFLQSFPLKPKETRHYWHTLVKIYCLFLLLSQQEHSKCNHFV